MIRYVVGSTTIWPLQRDRKLHDPWGHELDEAAIGSYDPQRKEFLQSAGILNEYNLCIEAHRSPSNVPVRNRFPLLRVGAFSRTG